MNEPRVIESVTNECQSLGRAHESSSARAEQLIACLEGEIAKRDAELAACRVAVENCEVFRTRIAEIEADRDSHQRCAIQAMDELAAIKEQEPVAWIKKDVLATLTGDECCYAFGRQSPSGNLVALYAAPVSEAKAQGVVQWPDADEIMQMAFEEGQPADDASGYCFELEEFDLFIERLISEVARLNAAPAAQAADAWIPVSERLPAVESRLDQECRVGTLSIAPLNVSAAVLVFDGEKVRSTRLEWFDGCLPLPYCITHWMPLPAAPAANSAKGVV